MESRFLAPLWLPWDFNALARRNNPGHAWIYAYIRLPGYRFLSWNMEPDYDEILVWFFGPIRFTRPETQEEQKEREAEEALAAAESADRDRYVEWAY